MKNCSVPFPERRTPTPGVIAITRFLEFDYLSAQFGQDQPSVWTGHAVAHLENRNAFKRLHRQHVFLFVLKDIAAGDYVRPAALSASRATRSSLRRCSVEAISSDR